MTNTISHEETAKNVKKMYSIAIDSDAIARAIAYVIEQPGDVDVNEMIIRPTKQELWIWATPRSLRDGDSGIAF